MHSRNKHGWAGILGSEDLSDDHERTDPNIELPNFADLDPDEEKTVHTHLEPKKVKPTKLKLPRPQSDSKGAPPPAVEFAVSVDEIVQKLEPVDKKDAPAKKKREEKLFTKEVILTIVGGVLLLGGTFAYSRMSHDEEVEKPKPTLMPVVETKVVVAPPPKVEPAPPPVETQPQEPQKAATPMLSIISSPSGAKVEINGTIYGSTPLIQPSPPNISSLSIRLLKDNYKNFEAMLTPNEAGHFNLNATMEKR